MREEKKRRLESRGWRVGSAEEFLGLTTAESIFVELRLRMAASVRSSREARALTQEGLAKLLGSSQSRIAKLEAADASVSLDFMVRAFLALGASATDVAKAIQPPRKRAA
ncbi:MAG: helix-turn-helix transcriptional regulator [Deltaproteobacteria bacterium]|nr:helix-turn-helix transcriptional regulator [Deltaproteobacteria bacterium]